MLAILVLGLLAVLPSDFRQFAAEDALQGQVVPPDVTKGKARRFRTVLREAAAEGPNFNGHYRVVDWGCGSNCTEWAVIDLTTGMVWFAPEPAVSCFAATAEDANNPRMPDWYEVHLESSLFYLHQCTERTGRTLDTRYRYVWKNGKMNLLTKEKLRY